MVDSKERFSIRPASSEVVTAEVEGVKSLIPPRGISVEERGIRNNQIRILLGQLSNEALWELRGYQLSRNELRSRLQRSEPFAVESLAQIIARPQDMAGFLPKGAKRMYALALRNMIKILPEVEPDEAVEALTCLFPKSGRPDGPVIEYLLRLRPDVLSIAEGVAARIDNPVLDSIRLCLKNDINPRVIERVSYLLLALK